MSGWSDNFKLQLHNRIKQRTIEVNPEEGKRILLKKGRFGGYRIINPPVIEENGQLKMMWGNFIFGGWFNLLKLLGFIAIFVLVFLSYSSVVHQYNSLATNVCYSSCFKSIGNAH